MFLRNNVLGVFCVEDYRTNDNAWFPSGPNGGKGLNPTHRLAKISKIVC
jgi:hypothetical protein